MHAIAFGAKRAFHSFLRLARKPLLAWPGLTGARFDMLSAFCRGDYGAPPGHVDLLQSDLRRRLGVCASVVSRMVRALAQLGWVKRERYGRTFYLSLTTTGERVIREARRLLLRRVERLVNDALRPSWRRQLDLLFFDLCTTTENLGVVSRSFGDRAILEYPFWPQPYDH